MGKLNLKYQIRYFVSVLIKIPKCIDLYNVTNPKNVVLHLNNLNLYYFRLHFPLFSNQTDFFRGS